MRTSVVALAAVVIGSVGLSACDKDSEVDLEALGQEAARTTCSKVYECCVTSELSMNMGYSGGLSECNDKTKASMGFWAAVIKDERAKGRLGYDGKLARRCLDAHAAATCEMHKGAQALDGCESFLTPFVRPGGACRASESCLGGSCMGVSETADGVCRPFAIESGSCAEAACGRGLFCDGSKICVRRKPDGAACGLHTECESQGCHPAAGATEANAPKTCGPKGGAATRCFVTSGCAYGGSVPGGAGVAVLVALLFAAGLLVRRRHRA